MIISTISAMTVVVALESQTRKAPNAKLVIEYGLFAWQLNRNATS